jgi:hypothetical protein
LPPIQTRASVAARAAIGKDIHIPIAAITYCPSLEKLLHGCAPEILKAQPRRLFVDVRSLLSWPYRALFLFAQSDPRRQAEKAICFEG